MDWKNEDLRYCSEYVYSEQYLNFIIRHNNIIDKVYERFVPDCVTPINSQYLIAYTRDNMFDISQMYKYGYQFVPKCYGLMDTSVIYETGTDRVSGLPGLELSGKDVLVGIVDTGIDYTMDVFKNSDGTTKIQYIWDQTIREEDVATAFGFGRVYKKFEIDNALESTNPYDIVNSEDEDGHGTFLASVAAGSISRDENFRGMAPDAELVVVKLKQVKDNLRNFYGIKQGVPCYGEDDIMLAVRFLIDTVLLLRKPMVILLGIGTSQGDHSGNTILDDYLNLLCTQRGIGVCVSGGNELGRKGHFHGESGDVLEISVGVERTDFSMEIWGYAPSLLRLQIESPTGEKLVGVDPFKNDGILKKFLYEGTRVYVENIVNEAISGNPLYFIRFFDAIEGIWKITATEVGSITNRGYDAYLPIYQFRSGEVEFVASTPDVTLCAPGNGQKSITVAACDVRENVLYSYSSRGFTRDGKIKPDIAAPGVEVYGAFRHVGTKDLFVRRSGSSVGCAVTAGAVALILEWAVSQGNNANITNTEIKQMLIRGAKRNISLEYPNNQWGWGALDVYETFNMLRQ